MGWQKHESCVYYVPTGAAAFPEGTCKLAGWDLDGTLILSDRGDTYAKGVSDWIWTSPNIPETLKAFRDAGWTNVIFSNRKGTPWGLKHVQKRLENIMTLLGFEVWIFFATKDDIYRKPNTGMLSLFAHLGGIKTWGVGSFFCGDAAGPTSKDEWHKWSDVDAAFAKAAGLTFYEPQQLFGTWPSPPTLGSTDTDLVITVGHPGAGWEAYNSYIGQHLPLGEGKHLTVVSDIKASSAPAALGAKGVVIVVGAHPSQAERERLKAAYATIYGKTPKTVIYWYARPVPNKNLHDKAYTAAFQKPIEATYRIN